MCGIEKKDWYPDYYQTTDDSSFNLFHFFRDFCFQHRLRFVVYFRIANRAKSKLIKIICDYKLFRLSRKYGLEIKSKTQIGYGFCLLHPYNITIHPSSIIGNNVTMMKGSTLGIGSVINGRNTPVVGNRVYIGINSTILGGYI